MKRFGNIYEKIYHIDNLRLAHQRAKKDKSFYREVKMVDENEDYYLTQIQQMLKNKTYNVTQDDYTMFEKNDKGKVRKIFKLDYFPHRIIQHALLIQIEDILLKRFIANTFSSLPKRGIHKAFKKLDHDLRKYPDKTRYCLQMDIRKFYPNIDHEINKVQHRDIFKDVDLLWLIDMLIDSLSLDDEGDMIILFEDEDEDAHGIAIGALFSQWDGNLYLSDFDHWIKEEKKVGFYYRYCDDLVILGDNKEQLHALRQEISERLKKDLKLAVKGNYKVFPVDVQGIDFVGYRHFRDYVLLRKSIAKDLIRAMRDIKKKMDNGGMFSEKNYGSINSYNGWLKWCNGNNLYETWIKPLKPHYDKYYEEVIKVEGIPKRKKYSKARALHRGEQRHSLCKK